MPSNHGDWFRAEQDGSYIYCAEDTSRRYRTRIHMSYLRKILRRWHRSEQYGHSAGRAANRSAPEACGQVFSPVIHPIHRTEELFQAKLASRLSDNARAREALRQCLPEPLRDATFSSVLRDDAATKRCLAQLLINLSDNVVDGSNNPGL